MAILFAGLLGYLTFTSDSNEKMRAVGSVTEDMICDILFVAVPLFIGLAALSSLIVIIKRCYGRKLFMIAMSIMFIGFAAIVFWGRGVRTDRTMRSLESPDGQHMLYYVQEYSERSGTDWMRIYRRTDECEYEALFSIDNDKTDLIAWSVYGVEYDDKKYDYSTY